MAYTTVFNGSPVQPSDVSYATYTLSAANPNIELSWPSSGLNTTNVVARKIGVSISDGLATYSISMPNATQVSPGIDVIFFNTSLYGFNVFDNGGDVICFVNAADGGAIPPTSGVQYISLTDNTTAKGVWDVVAFGALTGAVQASALAGDGLTTLAGNTKLNTEKEVSVVEDGYNIISTDRGKLLVYSDTSGTGVVNLPSAGDTDIGNGFWVAINNESAVGGQLEITPQGSDKIDGSFNPLILSQGESGFVVCAGGSDFYSLGTGKPTFFSASVLNLTVPSSGTVVLSNSEANNNIQQYISSGDLTGDVTVIFPPVAAQYYISNQTTGSYDLYIQLQGITGSKILIPQSEKLIVYTDAAYFYKVPTVAEATITNISQNALNTSGVITTGNPSNYVTNGSYYNIPGLFAQITPFSVDNSVLVTVTAVVSTDLLQTDSYLHFRLLRNGTDTPGLPSAAGLRILSLASVLCEDSIVTCTFSLLDNPNSAVEQTYQVQVASTSATPGSSNIFYNMDSNDTNEIYSPRCTSTITVTEELAP
jgi:hypothetical protein